MPSKLVIQLNGSGQGTVELDGTDIASAVYAVEFSAEAGHVTKVNLQLQVIEIELSYLGSPDQEILVNLTDDVINTLLVLGWNPPENDNRSYRVPATQWMSLEDFRAVNERPSAEEMEIVDRQSPDAND